MTVALALAVGVALVGGFALVRWHHGRVVLLDTCPACQAPPLVLAPAGRDHVYDVLACPVCMWAGAAVQDAAFRRCLCAGCGENALVVTVSRLPADPPKVHIHENCLRCGLTQDREAGVAPNKKLGRVVAYRAKPRRDGDATTEESNADVIPLFPASSQGDRTRTTNRS